jgi:hypothetical protein
MHMFDHPNSTFMHIPAQCNQPAVTRSCQPQQAIAAAKNRLLIVHVRLLPCPTKATKETYGTCNPTVQSPSKVMAAGCAPVESKHTAALKIRLYHTHEQAHPHIHISPLQSGHAATLQVRTCVSTTHINRLQFKVCCVSSCDQVVKGAGSAI